MYKIQDVAEDLKAAIKRRWALLIFSPILFVIAAILALYFIEPKFKASTTILVQENKTLNAKVLYEIEDQAEAEDRLQSLNEIIYSRSTIEILIDSLNLDKEAKGAASKQQLVTNIQKNIGIKLNASDYFEINYFDKDPVRARDGAELLANHFINTKLKLESRRNTETVSFFRKKLAELDTLVKNQRNQAALITTDNVQRLPSDSDALQNRLQSINDKLDTIEWKILQEEKKLANVKSFQNQTQISQGINYLYKLPLEDMQFGEELLLLLDEYDRLKQQFTENYPKLGGLEEQIKQIVVRMPPTLTNNISNFKSQKRDLIRQKQQVVGDMQQFFIQNQRAESQQSDFNIFKSLQADMREKLEQAKMIRDIGEKAADQFIVLDKAIIPKEPVSPNKILIIGIGLFIGIIMGIVTSAFAEFMDTTIRDESDLPFKKPIIAYITE